MRRSFLHLASDDNIDDPNKDIKGVIDLIGVYLVVCLFRVICTVFSHSDLLLKDLDI